MSNREIREQLHIEPITARDQVQDIRRGWWSERGGATAAERVPAMEQ